MAYLIRSLDGRTTICTACAEAAAKHVTRLRRSGTKVEVTDVNGTNYEVAGLHRTADALRDARTAILQAA